MGMTTMIKGLKQEDINKTTEFKNIEKICKQNGVEVPNEVRQYLDNLFDLEFDIYDITEDLSKGTQEIWRIKVSDLVDKGLDYIEFTNSY